MKIHPSVIVRSYFRSLDLINSHLKSITRNIKVDQHEELLEIVTSCLGTKFTSRYGDLVTNLAVDAVQAIHVKAEGKHQHDDIDIKKYARIEKIPGGLLEDSCVLKGVMINKDITHTNMRRNIKNPRVVLLDCPLEYKKGESATQLELTKDTDFANVLRQEEKEVEELCNAILAVKPDVVITEKGVSDLAQHFLLKQNVSVIRRVRKTDNLRIGRVTGATICNRPEELEEKDVGTDCGLFKIEKIGDEYFT